MAIHILVSLDFKTESLRITWTTFTENARRQKSYPSQWQKGICQLRSYVFYDIKIECQWLIFSSPKLFVLISLRHSWQRNVRWAPTSRHVGGAGCHPRRSKYRGRGTVQPPDPWQKSRGNELYVLLRKLRRQGDLRRSSPCYDSNLSKLHVCGQATRQFVILPTGTSMSNRSVALTGMLSLIYKGPRATMKQWGISTCGLEPWCSSCSLPMFNWLVEGSKCSRPLMGFNPSSGFYDLGAVSLYLSTNIHDSGLYSLLHQILDRIAFLNWALGPWLCRQQIQLPPLIVVIRWS